MKAIALASLTTLAVLAAGCDHMASRKGTANASAKPTTVDAPTRATTTSSSNEAPKTRGMPITGDADFDHMDVNRDGYLTQDELLGSPALGQNFQKIDSNGDARISLDEWKARGHH